MEIPMPINRLTDLRYMQVPNRTLLYGCDNCKMM